MNQDRAISHLMNLGLTSYEARAYVALTGRESCTASEASRLAGVPRQRIYDVLDSLIEKGLALTRPGSTVKYTATAPALALERLITTHRDRLMEMEAQASTLIDELTPAYRAGQLQTDPLEYIEVLRDPVVISARFDELQASVKREILVFTKPPYAIPPQENVEGLQVASTHRARSMYEFSLFEDIAATEGVRRFMQAGEEARVVAELPLKLVIIDELIVMFGMQDPVAGSSDLTIMVVEHPSLAQVLKMAFDSYWERGLPLEEAYKQYLQSRAHGERSTG